MRQAHAAGSCMAFAYGRPKRRMRLDPGFGSLTPGAIDIKSIGAIGDLRLRGGKLMDIAIPEALKRAQEVLASRFAGYSFAFAAGSIMRGEGKATSDVD